MAWREWHGVHRAHEKKHLGVPFLRAPSHPPKKRLVVRVWLQLKQPKEGSPPPEKKKIHKKENMGFPFGFPSTQPTEGSPHPPPLPPPKKNEGKITTLPQYGGLFLRLPFNPTKKQVLPLPIKKTKDRPILVSPPANLSQDSPSGGSPEAPAESRGAPNLTRGPRPKHPQCSVWAQHQ